MQFFCRGLAWHKLLGDVSRIFEMLDEVEYDLANL